LRSSKENTHGHGGGSALGIPYTGSGIAAGRVVLLSVHKTIRTLDPAPPHRGGHLVLAVGASPEAVVLHNPSGLPDRSQQFHHVPWSSLDRFYAGRGVVLGPSTGKTT
jgi:hypothetical protein